MLPFILLGLLQGLTEFLPISSSGHLALAEQLFRVEKPGIVFDIFVHFGTLLSVLWVFRERILRLALAPVRGGEDWRLLGLVIVGSIPTGILGLALDAVAEEAFTHSWAVGLGLLVTAGVLFGVERRENASAKPLERLTWRDALWVGLAQGIAVLPGISRSGSTIAMGLLCGLRREDAAEFSFLLFVPAIIGATLLKLSEALAEPAAHSALWGSYLAGTVVAFLSGVIAIRFLMKFLREQRMTPFAVYCLILGLLALGWGAVKI
ncbi:MAG: undecaprenyl-diphosphatase UppP [Candidatus Bipolaricaulota bacterium]|nr:undecaprenyl-diphosphatase UppP [Candidatus Bipolaricaulota bacterium]MCS7275260.1 undecaprenyl-diphosphatase UppP [Candidatus Bipolaricaulota bacterium]MDW8111617.1 undecaprenyl-diphosphatase UppP [Candidatus Bipolaricaulota bacterium]MDW8328531.1 undecaprenyl-diphosphatase UppP [Candidatus Bipolaricaulota bacterium]